MAKNKKNSFLRESAGDKVFNVINIAVFVLFTLICIFPFYYLFINTISDNEMVGKNLITLIPHGFHISNYIALKDKVTKSLDHLPCAA